jgi:hypothetical protein
VSRGGLLYLAVLLSLLSLSSTARAQEPSADELKTRGNQAMLELNYAEALVSYRAALAKNPSDLALHYNIGRAHQARGDYPAALDALVEFERSAPPETRAKVPSLGQLISDVRGRVGELNVHCSADVMKGIVTVAGPTGDLEKVDGCTVRPKKVRVSLASKSATLEVRLDSEAFQGQSLKVVVQGGGPAVDAALIVSSRTTSGILRIQAAPASAVIAVDGSPKGNSPVEVTIPAGSHVVDVTADGHEKAHVPVVLEAGGRRDLSLTLEKTPAITKRWWFWAGVGGAVATITTVVVILIVQPERDATRGTIDPGVVRAPLVTF